MTNDMEDEKPKTKTKAFFMGLAGGLGTATGQLLIYMLFVWLFREDIRAAATWVAAHIRIV